MKKNYTFGLLVILVSVLALSACGGSVPWSVTEAPMPTYTPVPTATLVPTAKPTPIVGVDEYVFYDGVNMRVGSAIFENSFMDNNNVVVNPPVSGAKFLFVDFQAFGDMKNVDGWSKEKNINKVMRIKDNLGNIIPWYVNMWNEGSTWLRYIFVVSNEATSFTLVFPDGTEVNLDSYLGLIISESSTY